eukprot:403346836
MSNSSQDALGHATDTAAKVFINFYNMEFLKPAQKNQKSEQIHTSKEAMHHFFKQEKLSVYDQRIQQDEKLREESLASASDSINYYNQKYFKKNQLDNMIKIRGSFLKVRAQGGASSKDIEEVNKLYKRSFVTLFAVVAHSYMTINFLYDSRLVTLKGTPKLYQNLPYVLYPLALAGSVYYMWSRSNLLFDRLDKKYTPIWIDISKKL